MATSTLGHALSVLPFFQLAVILVVSHLCGALLVRWGQSRVIGEICAGVLLGPCLLLTLGADWHGVIFPPTVQASVSTLGEIGLVLLMFQIGLRFDAGHLSLGRAGTPALLVAIGGVLLAFALGTLVGSLSRTAIAPDQPPAGFALFCGVALSITALPVLVRIIDDLHLGNTRAGTVGITTAAITDVIGWILLTGVATLSSAHSSWSSFMIEQAWTIAFLIVIHVVLRPLMIKVIPELERTGRPAAGVTIALMLAVALICAWVTTLLGLHSALGGLLAGVVLHELRHHWRVQMEGFVNLVLVPLYFAATGLRIDLTSLAPISTWIWFVAFLAAAISGKAIGCYFGGRLAGVSSGDARIIAVMMNTRGLIEIVMLSVGLDLGLISQTAFFLLLVVSVVCTLMTTPLLRRMSIAPGNSPPFGPVKRSVHPIERA